MKYENFQEEIRIFSERNRTKLRRKLTNSPNTPNKFTTPNISLSPKNLSAPKKKFSPIPKNFSPTPWNSPCNQNNQKIQKFSGNVEVRLSEEIQLTMSEKYSKIRNYQDFLWRVECGDGLRILVVGWDVIWGIEASLWMEPIEGGIGNLTIWQIWKWLEKYFPIAPLLSPLLIHRSIDILTLSQIQKGLRWERLSIDIVVQRLMDAALTMTQTNV